MSQSRLSVFSPDPSVARANFAGAGIWICGWCLLFFFDQKLDLANLGMLLILISALTSICFVWQVSALSMLISVAAFDWFFVPPRYTFAIDFHQHSLMLLVMLCVNLLIITTVSARRIQAQHAARHANETDFLRRWSDRLQAANSPYELDADLQQVLAEITGCQTTLLILKGQLPAQDDPKAVLQLGEAGIEQQHALWYSMRNSQQLGRGTGYYEIFFDVYLPLRTNGQAMGAALIKNFAVHEIATRVHLQAICDQFGQALESYRVRQQEMQSREKMQAQILRNNLLAAISHDYRTPLATITSAASSLLQQSAKLDQVQQKDFLQRILDEAECLNGITTNILQLARLDADKSISCDWQSVEEIAGDMKRRWRARNLDHRIHMVIAPQLPLVWCDVVLIGQLLDNLIDNAIKYSPPESPVMMAAEIKNNALVFSVTDDGPGVTADWQDKIFLAFQRGPGAAGVASGAGVGLALCRAIAEAHGGNMQLRRLPEPGTCFEFSLPLRDVPPCGSAIATELAQ